MAKCVAVPSALESLPILGRVLDTASAYLGDLVQLMVSGALNLDPIALAAFAVSFILLWGVYQFTRIGASFLALTGFFVFALCTV